MGRREVRDLMAQLKQEGKTVFFSTHILADAEALCDRVAIIHQGELRGVGAMADLTVERAGENRVGMGRERGSCADEGTGCGMPCHGRYGTCRAARKSAGCGTRGASA